MTASDSGSDGGRGRRLLVLAAVFGTLGALAVAAVRSRSDVDVDIGDEVEVAVESVESVAPDAVTGAGASTDTDPTEAAPAEPVDVSESEPAIDEPDATFELYEDGGGDWRWRLVGDEGANLARSPSGYDDREALESALDRLREVAPEAAGPEAGDAGFELYEDGGGNWRWRLREDETGLAVASRGYTDRDRALEVIERVRAEVVSAPTTTE